MKKLLLIILITLLSVSIYAQENENESETESDNSFRRLRLSLSPGIGFTTVNNDSTPDYNLNVGFADFLIKYRLTETLGVSSGISIHNLTGNGFNENGNFYKSRSDIKIPILFSGGYKVAEKITTTVDFGLFARSIISDDEQYLNFTLEDVYEGWGFGFQTSFTFMFDVSDILSVGINYNSLLDFNDFESAIEGSNQTQRLTSFNTFGVVVMYSL